jgi:hypothetical protein
MARRLRPPDPNERFYIKLAYANAFDPKLKRHKYAVWPILFRTRDDATKAVNDLPVFANKEAGAIADRPKIKSVSVERLILKKESHA